MSTQERRWTAYVDWNGTGVEEIDVYAPNAKAARAEVKRLLADPHEYMPGGTLVKLFETTGVMIL